jgi:cyclopropane fatty-acyl-phospholipid synthase-like methyltransferase
VSGERVRLFEEWAETYDESVVDYVGFPFEGYVQVLDTIASLSGAHSGMTVLDLGIGTGQLAERFLGLGCSVWGLDFSAKMLAAARAKFPQIELIKADLVGDWPIDHDLRFDRVVSGYALHELDPASKVRLIKRLARDHLVGDGSMIIGDISFPTVAARDGAQRRWQGTWDEAKHEWKGSLWDEAEHYWAADEAATSLGDVGVRVEYTQVSFCGGVYVIRPEGDGGGRS